MGKIIALVVVIALGAGAAWYMGFFGGGLSDDEINARLKARQTAHVEAMGTDITEVIKVLTINVRDATARHVVVVGEDMPFAEAEATITKLVCADMDAAELIASGATMRYEVNTSIGGTELGVLELKNCPA